MDPGLGSNTMGLIAAHVGSIIACYRHDSGHQQNCLKLYIEQGEFIQKRLDFYLISGILPVAKYLKSDKNLKNRMPDVNSACPHSNVLKQVNNNNYSLF